MAQPGMPRRLAPMALLTGAPGAAAPAVVAQAAAAQQTLSLTGQRRPLPLTIHAATAIVHLNACELADGDLDAHLVQAQAPGSVRHIGLAYNPLICSLKTLAPAARFPALVSLDVAFCGLADLSELAHLLHPLPLKSLVAAGNPLALLPCYRPYLISSLSSLEFLDDRRVSHHQHRLLTNFAAASDATAAAQVTISLGRIASLPPPPENDFTCTDPAPGADPPSDSTFSVSYSVGFDMPGRLAHLQPDGAPDSSNGTANAVADHLAALSSEDPSNFPSPAEPAHPRPAFQSASFPWAAEGVTSGHIWQLLVDDLPALKEALAAGIELSLFKTVVESTTRLGSVVVPGLALLANEVDKVALFDTPVLDNQGQAIMGVRQVPSNPDSLQPPAGPNARGKSPRSATRSANRSATRSAKKRELEDTPVVTEPAPVTITVDIEIARSKDIED